MNVCEPDKPVPDTFIVNVPLLTLAAVVAVLALPFKAAVIVPALKLPDASRRTMVEAVLAVAAVMVALLACPVTEPAVVANVAVEADVAEVAVAALPLIEMPHVPVAPVPPVDGAPTVLYEIVRATEPLNAVPDASPEPPLLNVTEKGVEIAE